MLYSHGKNKNAKYNISTTKINHHITKGLVARREGCGGWVKKAEGNIVNNIVISLPGARRLLELVG